MVSIGPQPGFMNRLPEMKGNMDAIPLVAARICSKGRHALLCVISIAKAEAIEHIDPVRHRQLMCPSNNAPCFLC